ncbi:fungal-specific transcription factor domain-containing protein [Lipomyces orientalis]|uniref:Fungal-specific transcription factor domain-containing protein n=1 Tax=Lipomyces orientalis TaxID=1233043 RepID=A0ACC3TET4_9ASCO
MDKHWPQNPSHISTIRSSNGCWTCRLRRKKCDENHPVCDACSALHITCHHAQDKPEWMDGGVKQEEMAERLKREVKEKAAYRRRGERAVHTSVERASFSEATTGESIILPQRPPRDLASRTCDLLRSTTGTHNDEREPCPSRSTTRPQRGADRALTHEDRKSIAFGRSDTILIMFYLEHLLPFLFPFYRPSILQGGRAWVLEMMISSPVVRQAVLCQSSYFFSLARGTANVDIFWETVLTESRNAFGVLRQALQVIEDSGVAEHLHGAVRIMASIMQVQRFEIAVLSFSNCQAHFNAAVALFRQLLDSPGAVEPAGPRSSYNVVISRLGLPSWTVPPQCVQIPTAEQSAFRFSSALLIFDDIVASTVFQERPRLYEYHRDLLGDIDGADPAIDLEAAVGCQNWALLQISEISVLDAWKQRCKRAGNLDVMELVRRATAIKDSLETQLTRFETDPVITPKVGSSLLDILTADHGQQSKTSASQSSLVTRVWAHAAHVYLFVVVSGWQPASVDVRYHVGRIVELLTRQISPPALLRTMVWPFCVAGCLAEPEQEDHFRGMVEALQPQSVFGTARKALEIMENVWRNRDPKDAASRDLATCFRSQGDLVLLV